MTDFVGYKNFISHKSDLFINIDCGHGGFIDGEYTTAPAKMFDHGDFVFFEGIFNRMVGLELAQLCIKKEVSFAFTTTSHYDTALSARAKTANHYKRLYSEKKHILTSIHGNAFKDQGVTGIEAWTDENKDDSDTLAKCILDEFSDFGWNNRGEKEKDLTVIYMANMPAVLLELGFYTNKEQAKMMLKKEIQEEMARRILNGITKWAQ